MTDGITITPVGILSAQFLGIVLLFYMLHRLVHTIVPSRITDAIVGIFEAAALVFLFTSPAVYSHILTTLHLTPLK